MTTRRTTHVRKGRSRGFVAIVALTLLASACTGGGGGEVNGGVDTSQTALERIRDAGVLRVNVAPGTEPGFIKGSGDDDWSGYYWEFEEAIAAAIGVELEPVVSEFGAVAQDLQSGRLDLAVGLNPTAERAGAIDYAHEAVFNNAFVVIARDDLDIDTWEGLDDPDVRLAVEAGGAHDSIAQRFAPGATITGFPSFETTVAALQSGRVDAIVHTLLQSLAIVGQSEDVDWKVIIPTPTVRSPSAIGVARQPGNASLINLIETTAWQLQTSGTSRQILLEHLGEQGVSPDDIPADIDL